MTKNSRLTKRAIDQFVYEGNKGSRDVRWDTTISGFGVRVYPTQRKSFVLSYRSEGRKHLYTVGPYGPLTLDQARNLALEKLSEVVHGKNPLAERKNAAQAKTIAELAELYMERHATNKKSSRDDKRRLDRHIVPRWRNIRIEALKRSDIAELHFKIGEKTPYEANRTLALLRKMLNLARQWGLVDEGWPNPASGIAFHREISRDRWLSPAELPKLAEAINAEKNIYARNALWIYLLTGLRKNELLTAKWEDVDWERNELRIGDTKSGKPHHVPLSRPAISVLQNLPKEVDNPYLLPGRKPKSHLVNISKAWGRVRKDAGVEDVRLHDLRRTVGSWLAQAGNDLHLIGKVLNHSSVSTTAIYARFGQDSIHQALEDYGEKLMNTVRVSSSKTTKNR